MKTTAVLMIGMLLGAAIVGTVYILLQTKKLEATPPTYLSTTPVGTETPQEAPQTGTLEGSLSFPSEGIPKDIEVCAEDVSSKQQYCTDTHIEDPKYTYKVGYMLNVPEGIYQIYAKRPTIKSRAYYSEFVTCGQSINCTSHTPIEIAVNPGEVVTGIDPQDWYSQVSPTTKPTSTPTI